MSAIASSSVLNAITHGALQPVSVPPGQPVIEKLYIGLDHSPHSFNLRNKVLGVGSANLQYISKETGVQISLRGIGSLHIEQNSNTELQEPLHLVLEHHRVENLSTALQLATNLIETLHQEFRQFQEASGQQFLPSAHPPAAQLNVPPLNVISGVGPASVTAQFLQPQQISLVQQQIVPQNGVQMQLPQNAMIIQQQLPNFNVPPPAPQASFLPMKPSNHIHMQFQQPTTGMTTQCAPFILNAPPHGVQYQYIQQTTTRDMQGNQQITFQPIIHQAQIPMQSQQQYIAVQQGNTTYMVPQSSIIQQAPLGVQPSSQLSIIHQQALSPPQPPMQVQQQHPNALFSTPQTQATLSKPESQTDPQNEALPMPSSSQGLNDSAPCATVAPQEAAEPPADAATCAELNMLTRSSHSGVPINNIPPPPLPGNSLLTGETANGALQPQQEIISGTPNGQPHAIGSNNSWQQQQMQAIGPQPPFAMTLAQQQTLLQPTQQLLQFQQQAQQQQTPFGVIPATTLNNANAFQQNLLQIQQMQSNVLQMEQQQIQFAQQQLMQQQQAQQQIYNQLQQQQVVETDQMRLGSTSPAASNSRPAQKRRPANEAGAISSPASGPPPNQKVRTGVGSQSNMTNNAVTSASTVTGNASNIIEAGAVSSQANSRNSPQDVKRNQQMLKPTHIGVMRYSKDVCKPMFDATCPPPRARTSNYNSTVQSIPFKPRLPRPQTNQHHTQQQIKHPQLPKNNNNSCGPRMQTILRQQTSPPKATGSAYSVGSAPS